VVEGSLTGMFRQAFWCARCLVPHSSQTKYYSFFIDRYGTYTLITAVDNTGTNDRVLREVSMYLYFWREEGLPRTHGGDVHGW